LTDAEWVPHCEHNILSALKDQPGVQTVEVDVPAKTVHLAYDDTALNLDQIKGILDEEGYPVAGVQDGNAAPRRSFIPLVGK